MDRNRYWEEQFRQKYNAKIFGAALSVGLNLCVVLCCSFSGLKYIYPPPQEKTLLVEFEQEKAPEIKIRRKGREPMAEAMDRTKRLEITQKSEAQLEGKEQNLTKEATTGTQGDVVVPEPPREESIDELSLFHAPKNTDKDTLAPHTAREVSDALKAGHAQGNATRAKAAGMPNARVEGRSTVGVPPNPSYDVQNEGTVVVEIWVDNQGAVTRATAGVEGSTVTNTALWNSARQAALGTRFNVDPEAPGLQRGTITYIFKLN